MARPKRNALQPDVVRSILRRCIDGRRVGKRGHPDHQTALARELGISQSTISKIVARKSYRDVKP